MSNISPTLISQQSLLFVFKKTHVLCSGEIYGDHGILTHVSPFNLTQGVVRNRKAIFNVPLNLKVIFKDRQLDLTYVNQPGTNIQSKQTYSIINNPTMIFRDLNQVHSLVEYLNRFSRIYVRRVSCLF